MYHSVSDPNVPLSNFKVENDFFDEIKEALRSLEPLSKELKKIPQQDQSL